MPFLQKRNTMKKSRLNTKRKKLNKNKNAADELEELTGKMKDHNIDKSGVNVIVESRGNNDVETRLRKVEEENQYLKLLLGMSHKVDQLYEIWTGHFPNAFSNADTLHTYLELHSKQKQSQLIIKTFRHVETIKKFLTDHKSQMLVSSASLGENILSNSDDHSDVLSSNISSSQNNEDDPPLGGPESLITSNIQSESEREVISTSKERVDLGRMMSQQGPIQLSVMCHCKGMCLKGCDCRRAGQSCGVRCGCSRDKCQWRLVPRPQGAGEETPGGGAEPNDEDKENSVPRDPVAVDIAPVMKNKRIMAPLANIREEADLEMSWATQKIMDRKKISKKKVHINIKSNMSSDESMHCSILAPRSESCTNVFSTPAFTKFRANHIKGSTDGQFN